jgi:hypothetical protein
MIIFNNNMESILKPQQPIIKMPIRILMMQEEIPT